MFNINPLKAYFPDYRQVCTSLFSVSLLVACGGGGSHHDSNASQATTQAKAKQSVYLKSTLTAPTESGDLTFSLSAGSVAQYGKFTITNAKTGQYEYLATEAQGTEELTYTVNDGTETKTYSLMIKISAGDPLYKEQWHLHNTGQAAFATKAGKAGEDMNVSEAIANGHHGEGIVVAVVDDGLEIKHPNLQNNILTGGSYNFLTDTNDPTPSDTSDSHGTAVGGIIAAEGWNNIGSRGVAPKASMIGFNLINSQDFNNFKLSLGKGALSEKAQIFNQSFGSVRPYPVETEQALNDIYQDVTVNSFNGKGSLFVKSAGNAFEDISVGEFLFTPETDTNNFGLPFHNANMSPDNSNFYNLVVSALNAEGTLSSYSSAGANVFVSAPGGEYGVSKPAILTTDLQGCHTGFSAKFANFGAAGVFDDGSYPLNSACNYTAHMNGTSAAAPNVSGAIAVIWRANPDLTWRDIRHILASTATQVDASIQAKTIQIDPNGSNDEYIALPAWTTNAAGFHFHDFYGFGRVNVSDAVAMATSYKTDLGQYQISGWKKSENINAAIPDGDINGVSDTINVVDDWIVEGVQIQLTAKHGRLPDLAVELISPSGTRSVVMTPYNGYVYQGDLTDPADHVDGFDNTLMLSNAFYGEPVQGDWTIKLVDVNNGLLKTGVAETKNGITTYKQAFSPNEANGELQAWSIQFHGHSKH
ncbi:S8 family serine peptidase [uncultured Shewanella sp.]|uniref:S8 family serine peptidase n=1 Tax=uncultured Shewanella sp. TaxID=173975 RepID=UPI00262BE4A8|nr:S8 family serine peptidase [uncultured Shewanella sp.]